jgi:5-(carboxyamino)imidazole ribonucleotide synthase
MAVEAELSPYTFLKKFNHVGLLAVEMFQTEDDEILVNEVAPRPQFRTLGGSKLYFSV